MVALPPMKRMQGLRYGAAIAASLLAFAPHMALACEGEVAVCETGGEGRFLLAREGSITRITYDAGTSAPVQHAAQMFAEDLGRVTGSPGMATNAADVVTGGPQVLVGTLADPAIAAMVADGSLDVSAIAGKWEGYVQAVVGDRLVVAGNDARGAVYGLLDLSERIGVSPWHWWADVPVERRQSVWLNPGSTSDSPGVRYRGFFINDEDPAFGGWATEKFGGVNSKAYAHVFDLLLRLKGNYIWPAMWGKSLVEDDPASLALAAETGVVLGTSHHEPLTRAHVEWEHAKEAGKASGDWNYATNDAVLRDFWAAGMKRHVASGADAVVTIGMRGDGDEAMSEDTAIPLLEQVVADQRRIIADATGKPASETPQVWALYKEVQDYYDQGMQVPSDVTLLFADDNWGQIRRLPAPGSPPRDGGYGVYYHFDYVGGPRSYKWIDTIQNGKTWQQMNLAWERGARDLWIVNVGDIKPAEAPLDFFLDMAWDPEGMTPDALGEWSHDWARQQFGEQHAGEIAGILDEYARLASRKKPELIDPTAFTLDQFRALVAAWDALVSREARVRAQLSPDQQDAWYGLVGHRVLAMANLYRLHSSVAFARHFAESEPAQAAANAEAARMAFARDAALTQRYHAMGGGKWNRMMSQSHIGYTAWNDPPENIMPDLAPQPVDETSITAAAPVDPAAQFLPAVASQAAAPGPSGLQWQAVPELGSYGYALVALPQGQPATTVQDGVFVDYMLNVPESGQWQLDIRLVPTLDTIGNEGLRFAVQVDDDPVVEKRFYLEATNGQFGNPDQVAWNTAVISNHVRVEHDLGQLARGQHRLRIYRIDDNVVLDSLALRPAAGGEGSP